MHPKDIAIADFDYDLPSERIALHPLANRDESRLLIYKNNTLTATTFADLPNHLPAPSLLIFNNSRVINARILFTKNAGTSPLEIFCLEPYGSITNYAEVMSSNTAVTWKCFVGGAAKWKTELLQKEIIIQHEKVTLFAKKIKQVDDAYIIELYWQPNTYSFAQILVAAGTVPLPPYLKRTTIEDDTDRYQTIYADHNGSVAAPTAGLHFTHTVFTALANKKIIPAYVTLHVGAGTFKPVKAITMSEHQMHAEYISVNVATLTTIINNLGQITAVGTTSLRTIESLYWFGVKVHADSSLTTLSLSQWEVYSNKLLAQQIPAAVALSALIAWMQLNNLSEIFTQTQILIAPTYQFKIANRLVTNFHQPKSTLLLLVAAAIGNDWKKIYDYALQHEYRFLSYGDANLIYL